MTGARWSYTYRCALIGALFGGVLAVWCLWPQVSADLRGVNIMGPAEMMFLTSLPVSLLTYLGFLIPATDLFGPNGNLIPRWVAYVWMATTPPLNWAAIGAGIGWWLDHRRPRLQGVQHDRPAP
jgi:hypothetical protein